jgi:hypothetical protein
MPSLDLDTRDLPGRLADPDHAVASLRLGRQSRASVPSRIEL